MDRVDNLLKQWAKETPTLDATSMGIIGRIMLLNKLSENAFDETLANYNINLSEFDLLAVLRRCGPPFKSSASALCAHSLLSSGAMTNRIDRLEKKQLVARESNPDDRRGVLVALTDKGKQLIDTLIEQRFSTADKFISAISDDEKKELEKLLRKLLLSVDTNDNK